jgi:hypothetical protein
VKNSIILATDKQIYKILYISNKCIPLSLMYFNNKIDGHVLYQCILIYRIIKIKGKKGIKKGKE